MRNKKAENPVDAHVGARLRMRRLMLRMSQERLGAALGITSQQVQNYEKGTNRIGAGRLQDIARLLDVAPSFFFEGLEPQKDENSEAEAGRAGDAVGEFVLTREVMELSQAFAAIGDPKVRRRLLLLVASLGPLEDGFPEQA